MQLKRVSFLAAVTALLALSSSAVFADQYPGNEQNPGQNPPALTQQNAPAPIPGILALMAAAGGGALIRRKIKKNKPQD